MNKTEIDFLPKQAETKILPYLRGITLLVQVTLKLDVLVVSIFVVVMSTLVWINGVAFATCAPVHLAGSMIALVLEIVYREHSNPMLTSLCNSLLMETKLFLLISHQCLIPLTIPQM